MQLTNIELYFLLALLATVLIKVLYDLFKIKKRFKPVIEIDYEVNRVQKNLDELSDSYSSKKSIYDNLTSEVLSLTDKLEMMDFGLYEPKFEIDDSDSYKEEIKDVRKKQKKMIRDKTAIPPNYNWVVDNSRAKGKADINQRIRLALRAFNGECDSLISKVSWNNVESIDKRIRKSEELVNKFLTPFGMSFDYDFVQLKLDQLYLTHEYKEKKYEEKENRRLIAKEEREERKVLKEAEAARKAAEEKENIYHSALEQARKDLGLLSGSEMEKQQKRIDELEANLKKVLEDKERAISRAQLTKSGHVYIISNIGSFGKDVYKIGLTRRLEPEIRVRELGDASVPFSFDIHAMIYSDDAPSLEKKLHNIFDDKRVNLANTRKEYFKVSIEDIKDAVYEIDNEVDFISTTESREYFETMNMKTKIEKKISEMDKESDKFPESI